MSLRDEIERLLDQIGKSVSSIRGDWTDPRWDCDAIRKDIKELRTLLDKHKVPDCKKCKRIKLSKRRDLKFLILAFKAGAQEAEATIRFDFPEDITIAERVWGALQDCWQPPLPNQSLCARTKALKEE